MGFQIMVKFSVHFIPDQIPDILHHQYGVSVAKVKRP